MGNYQKRYRTALTLDRAKKKHKNGPNNIDTPKRRKESKNEIDVRY